MAAAIAFTYRYMHILFRRATLQVFAQLGEIEPCISHLLNDKNF
jgi:hypothetical protein